jgi:hypothetical protein
MTLAWNQGDLGPFYLSGAPDGGDSLPGFMFDSSFPGPLLNMKIRVTDTRDHYLTGSNIEIWHADEKGHFDTSNQFKYRRKWNVLGLHGEIDVTTALPGITTYNNRHLSQRIYLQVEPPKAGATVGHVTDWRGHIDLVLPPWTNQPSPAPQGDPRSIANLGGPNTSGFGGRTWYGLNIAVVLEYDNDPYYTNG